MSFTMLFATTRSWALTFRTQNQYTNLTVSLFWVLSLVLVARARVHVRVRAGGVNSDLDSGPLLQMRGFGVACRRSAPALLHSTARIEPVAPHVACIHRLELAYATFHHSWVMQALATLLLGLPTPFNVQSPISAGLLRVRVRARARVCVSVRVNAHAHAYLHLRMYACANVLRGSRN